MPKIKYPAALFLLIILSEASLAADCVVLLHGLARTSNSMSDLEERLSEEGYLVRNIDYPSRHHPVEELADIAVKKGLTECAEAASANIHFVTHSLGGILVRFYFKENEPTDLGRVVMLAPPNQGSEAVDNLKNMPGFELLNGPAGKQLGTKSTDIPRQLGPVEFELGIIAGTQSINWILSTFLPNPDDGKVSVEATKVEGMNDFLVLPVTHPLMMKDETVIEQTIHFLQHGRFKDIE